MPTQTKKSFGVLTSGGDAPGMNAAVRAIVRTALNVGVDVYAIYEGYRGMVAGGEQIRQMTWDSVGGILQQGGTIIGSMLSGLLSDHYGRYMPYWMSLVVIGVGISLQSVLWIRFKKCLKK